MTGRDFCLIDLRTIKERAKANIGARGDFPASIDGSDDTPAARTRSATTLPKRRRLRNFPVCAHLGATR
uniref:Rhodanese domain-containing protein n=1 Tax=Steinernema glaseri TaxID=37863 RepID=A0A1I7YXT7_9BILA